MLPAHTHTHIDQRPAWIHSWQYCTGVRQYFKNTVVILYSTILKGMWEKIINSHTLKTALKKPNLFCYCFICRFCMHSCSSPTHSRTQTERKYMRIKWLPSLASAIKLMSLKLEITSESWVELSWVELRWVEAVMKKSLGTIAWRRHAKGGSSGPVKLHRNSL